MNEPRARVVLLGASNLTRGISPLFELARRRAGAPAEFLVAMGHGRSYGRRSTVLGRGLPGILECGLWEALAARRAATTYALLTDIGNDVIYGSPVETILGWVSACLDRLEADGARVAVSAPPISGIRKLSPRRFRLVKGLLFPGRPLTFGDALKKAEALTVGIHALGERRGVTVIDPDDGWYGLDPIHPRRRRIADSWRALLAPWGAGADGALRPSPARWARLRALTPQRWWLAGVRLGRAQPSGRWPDGTTVALY